MDLQLLLFLGIGIGGENKMESKEMTEIRIALREAKCQGYEHCIRDMIQMFKRVQDMDPVKIREEVRRFIKVHSDPIA